jgi:hypothetical protein
MWVSPWEDGSSQGGTPGWGIVIQQQIGSRSYTVEYRGEYAGRADVMAGSDGDRSGRADFLIHLRSGEPLDLPGSPTTLVGIAEWRCPR